MLRPVFTVPVSAVHGLLAGAHARGVASPQWLGDVLAHARIDPALLAVEGGRVTVDQYISLFSIVMERLDDDCLGHLSRPLRRGSFALTVRAALGARTLESATHRVTQAFSLLQDEVKLVDVTDGELRGVALDLRTAPPAAGGDDFLHWMLLRVFWRLLVWLHGGRLVPRRFDFAFEQPGHATDYAEIFAAPLHFRQARSAVWFDAAEFAQPMRRDVTALQDFLRATPGNLVGPHLVERATSARVRALLQRCCPDWPDLEATAARLHMSVSALQRHLAAEGTSYQALKDHLRRDMAIVRLTTTADTLPHLAADLGFTDSTAFQRAFKGWTGSAPGAYRTRARQ